MCMGLCALEQCPVLAVIPHGSGLKRNLVEIIMPNCPQCASEYAYHDGTLYVCPECNHEWQPGEESATGLQVKDSNGNLLADGDSIILIKDLKLKGGSTVLKKGAKARNIRLVEGDHQIDCKVDDIKVMLKAEFVKKA